MKPKLRVDGIIKKQGSVKAPPLKQNKMKLTETQELWLEKMTTDYGLTRDQAINYLNYNEKN